MISSKQNCKVSIIKGIRKFCRHHAAPKNGLLVFAWERHPHSSPQRNWTPTHLVTSHNIFTDCYHQLNKIVQENGWMAGRWAKRKIKKHWCIEENTYVMADSMRTTETNKLSGSIPVASWKRRSASARLVSTRWRTPSLTVASRNWQTTEDMAEVN